MVLMAIQIAFFVSFSLQAAVIGERLQLSGNHFTFKGQNVFLSGGNLPWINYAHDFGNNQWAGVKSRVANQMKMLRDSGGNSMRLWIHIQGETSPQFNSNGYVTATDSQGTFINDFKDMLDTAKSNDILVVPTLWNAAVDQDKSHRLDGLIVDTRKLESYIRVVLTPLVRAVKGHPALGAWDIINEPEGMIKPGEHNSDTCFDTMKLRSSGAGWAGTKYTYQQILRFINMQADAIHQEDPQALVTVGVWNPKSNTDSFGLNDHYKDSCLLKAGQRPLGKLDFYQFHSYSWQGKFDEIAPFKHQYKDYHTSKPVVVGEFWKEEGGGMTSPQLFEYVYRHGYMGAWSWDLVGHGSDQRKGIDHIRDYTGNGKIHIDI